jgi:PAS domain-containing protein
VIDVNPAAERLLGMLEQEALGRSLDAVLARAGGSARVQITPIRALGHVAGQLAWIEPRRRKPDD